MSDFKLIKETQTFMGELWDVYFKYFEKTAIYCGSIFLTPTLVNLWSHMLIPWHGNTFLITGHLWGESTSHHWIPIGFLTQGNNELCHVFIVSLNKLLNKQSSCLSFEMPWFLWRHSNEYLTHWHQAKMTGALQITVLNAVPWMNIL